MFFFDFFSHFSSLFFISSSKGSLAWLGMSSSGGFPRHCFVEFLRRFYLFLGLLNSNQTFYTSRKLCSCVLQPKMRRKVHNSFTFSQRIRQPPLSIHSWFCCKMDNLCLNSLLNIIHPEFDFIQNLGVLWINLNVFAQSLQ